MQCVGILLFTAKDEGILLFRSLENVVILQFAITSHSLT